MISPSTLRQSQPLSARALATVASARAGICDILARQDHRLLIVVGPCSIHDPQAALEYASRLVELQAQLRNDLLIVMRTYFEKPRTTVGWRGFIDDPHLDGSCDIEAGLASARSLLLDINVMGLPCATESLDPMLVGYTEDLVSWTALGARTTESQVHRAMASGLAMPIGVKNSTAGTVEIAVDALQTINHAQTYVGLDEHGRTAIRRSPGNAHAHVVLRGGSAGPNYDAVHVAGAEARLTARGLAANLVIDCSHANSAKRAQNQIAVLADISQQLIGGDTAIVGVMLEGHLHHGKQSISADSQPLSYGVSVTDECLGWDDTALALQDLCAATRDALRRRHKSSAAARERAA